MQPTNIQKTIDDISQARISSYKHFFGTSNQYHLYGLYSWNEEISCELLKLISTIEVVMRNRFHLALSQKYHTGGTQNQYSNDWYNQAPLNPKSKDKIKGETHFYKKGAGQIPKNPQPSPNNVISNMTFGFWKNLLDMNISWDTLIPTIVPNHRYTSTSHWAKEKNRDALYARIELINNLRNRVAHFEPIWKLGDLYNEGRARKNKPLVIEKQKPQIPQESIDRLKLLHERSVELLEWLSNDRANDYKSSHTHHKFKWLCSIDTLNLFMNNKHNITLPISKFKREFKSLVSIKKRITLTSNNKKVGVYFSNHE